MTTVPPVPPRKLRMGHPAPGVEYPFSISDIAHAAALTLGPEWGADAGHWGICGYLFGPDDESFTLLVDIEGDLCLTYDREDQWPESPQLPPGVREFPAGLFLPDVCVTDGLDHIAQQLAAAVRAVTGR
ncbi:hypothetical protein ACFV2V_25130 [Streptomyces sp. NPDC059698]|uniref:hypothetical protein n=1 Tax=unclassified Streptomyces TaxID=2593676 RepID=UPI00364DB01A